MLLRFHVAGETWWYVHRDASKMSRFAFWSLQYTRTRVYSYLKRLWANSTVLIALLTYTSRYLTLSKTKLSPTGIISMTMTAQLDDLPHLCVDNT